MASNFDKAIDELMNTLDDDETDIKKMTDVTHKILMAMSFKKAMDIIEDKEKRGEVFTKDEKVENVVN